MLYLVLFFFVKQNTAYEMRISDWSSDVCSSDLTDAPSAWGWILEYLWDGNKAEGRGFHTADGVFPMHFTFDLGVSARLYEMKTWQREAGNGYFNEGNPRKIGRASGRERVCPYV